jgi:hypothetical protein
MQVKLECRRDDQSKRQERAKPAVREPRRLMPPVYEEILTHVHNVLVANNAWLTDVARNESAHSLSEFSQKMTACGSAQVKKALLNLSQATSAYATAPSLVGLGNQLEALEELLLAIRGYLGHENGDSKRGAWLPLFVSDFGRFLNQT